MEKIGLSMTFAFYRTNNLFKCIVASCALFVFPAMTHASWGRRLMPDFYFSYESSTLSQKSIEVLEAFNCKIGNDPLRVFIVIGHASKDERNPDRLSKQRAEQVKKWLVKKAGWSEDYIWTEGKAASQSIYADQVVNRNRRVETETVEWKPSRESLENNSCGPLN